MKTGKLVAIYNYDVTGGAGDCHNDNISCLSDNSVHYNNSWDHVYQHIYINFKPAWICNNMLRNVWDEISIHKHQRLRPWSWRL